MNLKIEGVLRTIAIIIITAMIYGIPVVFLWNWLVVPMFNAPYLSFLQAVGIRILCSLLFAPTIKVGGDNHYIHQEEAEETQNENAG